MKRLLGFDKLFRDYRWALLSGFFVGTSYIPFPPWAVLFCWVPLWWACLHTTNLKTIFKHAWVSQFLLTIIGFHWISYVSHEFGFMPWPLAILVLLLFASTVHLYIPIAVVLARYLGVKLKLNVASQVALMAIFHVIGETYWPSLFSWNLGYTLYWSKLPIYQIADVFGFLGLSLMLHFANALIVWVILRKDSRTAMKSLSYAVFAFAALTFWGHMKARHWKETDSQISVLLVQANIGNFEKVMAEKGHGFQDDISQRYFKLTREALQDPAAADTGLVIWPETAYPEFLGNHNANRLHAEPLINFVKEIKKPLITGSYGNDPPGTDPKKRAEYNSLFLYGTDGITIGDYKKTNLLAFGEYTPFGEIFPILKKYNPGGSGWGPGSGPVTLPLGDLKLGPQICYDSLYDLFTARAVRNGAQLLVNLTNDSWFGPRSEPYQHMIMTLARAVENRRPMLRSTNTGISTVALASGEILEQSPIHRPWAKVYSVPFQKNPEMTFFTRFRYLLPVVLALLIGIAIIFGRERS